MNQTTLLRIFCSLSFSIAAIGCNGNTTTNPDVVIPPDITVRDATDTAVAIPSCPNMPDGSVPARPACTVHIAPGSGDGGDDTTPIQTALITSPAGSVICFDDGTFHITSQLTLSTRDITLQGSADGAILDFAGQISGANSIYATADGFTIQYLTVKNSQGDGIRVEGADGVVFRHVHALWDGGSNTANGAYSIYPVSCGHVLVEDCEVEGAADSGLYVGQSHDVIVRRNRVHGNVGGLEIENCSRSNVYDNDTYDNTAGILVFRLPGLMSLGEGHAKVHDNRVYQNDRANFCHPGGVVCGVPSGIGVMVMAADNTEVDHNAIHDNGGVGVLVVDFRVMGVLPGGGGGSSDAGAYNPVPHNTCIHDNRFSGNGVSPQGILAGLQDPDTGMTPDILWSGDYDAMPVSSSCTANTVNLCIPAATNVGARFRCGNAPNGFMFQLNNIQAHDCPCTSEACVSF